MADRKRVLVTGGAGFIGSHVADAFLAGGYDVVVVDNLSSGRLPNLPDCFFVEVDIRSLEFKDLLHREHYDVVCHLAAQIEVSKIDVPLQFEAARPGEVLISVLQQEKAHSLGLLSATTKLRDGLAATFEWFSMQHSMHDSEPSFPLELDQK